MARCKSLSGRLFGSLSRARWHDVRVANASVRLPSGEVIELDDEQQARLDRWVVEAQTDDLPGHAGRAGRVRKDGEADRRYAAPEAEFDPGSEPCRVCGLRVGEGLIAWEAHGGNKWLGRHKSAMKRGDEGAEPCEAARAADRAFAKAYASR